MRVQPSGRVTAKPLSATSIRPLVARLAPAVALGSPETELVGAAVVGTAVVGVTLAGAAVVGTAVVPGEAEPAAPPHAVTRTANRAMVAVVYDRVRVFVIWLD